MNDHMKGGHEQVGRYKASHKSNSHYSLTRDSHWNITRLTMFTLLYDYLRYSMLSYIIVIAWTDQWSKTYTHTKLIVNNLYFGCCGTLVVFLNVNINIRYKISAEYRR